MPSAHKLLQVALAVFGVVALLVYPLALVWPSGWAWHSGAPYQSEYFMMIVGVYATLGRLSDQRGAEPGSQSQFDLVRRVVQCRTRRNHGGAVLQ